MTTRKAKVVNEFGIHCRPSGLICRALLTFPGVEFSVDKGDGSGFVLIDSLMSIIALCAECGCELVIQAQGPNEEVACEQIARMFERNFDFER